MATQHRVVPSDLGYGDSATKNGAGEALYILFLCYQEALVILVCSCACYRTTIDLGVLLSLGTAANPTTLTFEEPKCVPLQVHATESVLKHLPSLISCSRHLSTLC